MPSLIKEINRLISKGMYVFLFDICNGFLKTDILKTSILLEGNLKTCTTFKEQKGTKYILGNVYFGIIVFSCLSSTKLCLRYFLMCFDREITGFYQSSL